MVALSAWGMYTAFVWARFACTNLASILVPLVAIFAENRACKITTASRRYGFVRKVASADLASVLVAFVAMLAKHRAGDGITRGRGSRLAGTDLTSVLVSLVAMLTKNRAVNRIACHTLVACANLTSIFISEAAVFAEDGA